MTLDHPDYLALTAAVLADPADDMPRLVAADWLEENAKDVECPACKGDGRLDADHRPGTIECRGCVPWGSGRVPNGFAEYAEFIRVQVELATTADPHSDRFWDGQLDKGPESYRRRKELRKREADLALKHLRDWFPIPVRGHVAAITDVRFVGIDRTYFFRRGFVDEIRCPLRLWVGGECERCGGGGQRVGADRPFEYTPNAVEALRCPACHGLGTVGGIGPELVRRCPLTKVTLTDREPLNQTDGCWTWSADERDVHLDHASRLPWRLFLLLKGGERLAPSEKSWERGSRLFNQIYPTRQAALDALSAACLGWARGGVPSHG